MIPAHRMELLFVADLHYTLKQFDWVLDHAGDFDAVIIGGDLLDLGSVLDSDVQIVVIEKYLHRLRERTRVIVSSGNHDGDSRNDADESVASWIRELGTENLWVDGTCLEIPGGLISVLPWWDGPVTQAEVEAQLVRDRARVTPGGRWIWIHHAPPSGSPVCWTGKKFAGDDALRGWIETFQPAIVLSGHIHNAPFTEGGAWSDRIGATWVFNPGRQIGSQPTFLAVDLDQRQATWISMEGRCVQQLAWSGA